MRSKLRPDIQEDIVTVVHDNVLVRQIEIIRRIYKTIAIPAYTKREFLNNPLGALQISHAQSNRGVTTIAAANRFQTLQHCLPAKRQSRRTAAKDRNKSLTAEQHAERQQHHSAGYPVTA